MLDVGHLALHSERQAYLRDDQIRLKAQSALEVLDCRRGPALLRQSQAPVRVGYGEVRLQAQRVPEMFYCLGETAMTIDGVGGPDDLSRDVQNLEEIFDRFVDVASSNERHPPIIMSFGKVGPETKRLPEMFDRPGVIPLTIERLTPVVMRESILRPDAHGSLKMFDRLDQPALTIELNPQVVLRDDSVGFHGKDMGPQPLRVMPDVDLVPGEDSPRADDR